MIGHTISHYRILEKLGEGGMGVVYKAEDTQLRRTVALKFLAQQGLSEPEIKARLVREAQAAAALDHPHICGIYGIHEEDGRTFIAMAYIDGMSLAGKIKQRPLALEEALTIAIQIGEGLQEAHEQSVIHRDVKPANIMLTRKGQVKIMDFGLAYLAGRSKLTRTGTTMGTPVYMSPEQAMGQPADRRSDIWSLGVVLYEMLAGKLPFESEYQQAIVYSILNEPPEPLTACRSGLPVEIDRIMGKALAKNPDERYQHVDDFAVDLKTLREQSKRAVAKSGETKAALAGQGATGAPVTVVPSAPPRSTTSHWRPS
jgi:serine/threonine protein kinase